MAGLGRGVCVRLLSSPWAPAGPILPRRPTMVPSSELPFCLSPPLGWRASWEGQSRQAWSALGA